MENDSNPNESDQLITIDEIDEIKEQEPTFISVSEKDMKKKLIKKIIISAIVALAIIIPIIFLSFRPKDIIVYQKYEEFGPCFSGNNRCFQRTTLYDSKKLTFEGQIEKKSQISQSTYNKVKSAIVASGLLKTDCQETQILMEYKVTHTFFVGGIRKEIKAPACENELDSLDINLENLLK